MGKWSFLLLAALLLSSTLPRLAAADVVVERAIKSGGFMGMGASDIKEKEFLQGKKKRTDSTSRFTGSFLGKLAGGDRTSCEIIRVDKGLVWDLDQPAATYTERPIKLATGDQEQDQASASTPAEESADQAQMNEEEWRVVKNEAKLEDTGETKTINGFECRHYLLTWLVQAKNIKTGELRTNRMTGDFWNTPLRGPVKALQKEERTFNAAYLKELGLDMSPEQMGQFGLNFMGSLLTGADQNLQKSMARMKGYPIVSTITWKMSEPREQAAQKDQGVDLSNGIGGALGSLFGNKVKEMATGEKEAKDGMKTVFDSRTEILAIHAEKVAPVQFEIPKSYKKVN